MNELHIYDFDGTLFRSPGKPNNWKGGWWSNAVSLDLPFVPRKPEPKWWVMPVVADAKKSISNPNVYTVLMTGRLVFKGNFKQRIPELVRQQGLNFDEVLLCSGNGTEQWKLGVQSQLVESHGFNVVHIWEDREAHLANFTKMLEDKGVEVRQHLIKVPTPKAKHVEKKHLKNR